MSLPIASRIANRDMKLLGRTVGGIFSINTMGSVTGALLTGLILIPQLGVKLTLETGLLLNGLLGVFLLFKAGIGKRLKMSVLFSALLLFAG
jgi:predicted membrane-bound spermidine synthase